MLESLGVDRRVIKPLARLGFVYPTVIQAKTIPIALQGLFFVFPFVS